MYISFGAIVAIGIIALACSGRDGSEAVVGLLKLAFGLFVIVALIIGGMIGYNHLPSVKAEQAKESAAHQARMVKADQDRTSNMTVRNSAGEVVKTYAFNNNYSALGSYYLCVEEAGKIATSGFRYECGYPVSLTDADRQDIDLFWVKRTKAEWEKFDRQQAQQAQQKQNTTFVPAPAAPVKKVDYYANYRALVAKHDAARKQREADRAAVEAKRQAEIDKRDAERVWRSMSPLQRDAERSKMVQQAVKERQERDAQLATTPTK